MDSVEWFYVDIDGESKGPITTNAVKQLPLDVFVWNGTTVTEWTELKDLQSLLYDDNKHEQYQNNNGNANPKPKLENYWSISNKMKYIDPTSPSRTLTIAENDFDYKKYSIEENNNILMKSNLQKQLHNNNYPKEKRKKVTVRVDVNIIKQSVTNPPQFSPDNVITSKFEKILDELQIAQRARPTMREWTEDKKLQMILQYDFQHKSDLLNKKKKSITKKRKKLFKRNSKKKSFSKKKQNDKEWNFGFNPLPIGFEKDEKFDNYNGNRMNKSSIQTATNVVTNSTANSTEIKTEYTNKFSKNNNVNEYAKLDEMDKKQQGMYNEENIYISDESTKQSDYELNGPLSISKNSNIDYDDCDDSFIAKPVVFSIVNEKVKKYDGDANTLSVQYDYLNMIQEKNESNIIIENVDENEDENGGAY